MKQTKKIFTRILLNNWGGISHKVMELNEYVNLFSGKSGSGKSTVMDALQVVLYGSLASAFLNKAADDAKNRRSVLSYLRGEQKDGSANRGNKDFSSQAVLEIKDTGTKKYTCVGITFDVGRADQDIKNYHFFSHVGRIPDHEYLTGAKIAFNVEQMRALVKERSNSAENRGKGDINRLYPSNESYKNTLYDVILGYIDGSRFQTMEKSAIALKMTNGTGQFIRDYMFPRSTSGTVEKISEQLGAYRDISEKIEDLEKRIELLEAVRKEHLHLQRTGADIIKAEKMLKYMEIESVKVKLTVQQQELEAIVSGQNQLRQVNETLTQVREDKSRELVEVKADLKASDYGKKKEDLQEIENTLIMLSGNSQEWRRISDGISRWGTDETITEYVSNPALHLIERFRDGTVTAEDCENLRSYLKDSAEEIENQLQDLEKDKRELSSELKEKAEAVEDLKNNRKPYDKKLTTARSRLQQYLTDRYGRKIEVFIFADLFDIRDEEWKDAIEGRLGQIKHHLITEPRFAHDAAVAFKQMKEFESVQLINSAAISADAPRAEVNSLYEAVHTEKAFADICLKRYLGRVIKCLSVEGLEQVRDGVTPDCYSYSNYIYRHLRKKDYTSRACIGTKISPKQLQLLEEEVGELRKQLSELVSESEGLKNYRSFEMLRQTSERLIELSRAEQDLKEYLKKKTRLEKEIADLESGEWIKHLEEQIKVLEDETKALQQKISGNHARLVALGEQAGRKESDIKSNQESLELLQLVYVPNEALEREVQESLTRQSETSFRSAKKKELEELELAKENGIEMRFQARQRFNEKYKLLNLSGMEKNNEAYDRLLDQYQYDFEPAYKEEFQEKYNQVYLSLRENVIATIHGEIKAAHRHKREINRMLKEIQFSDSVYQIDVLPAENQNGQFYEMLMAAELDSKAIDNYGFDGQMSFGEDEFQQKYGQKIKLLTEKFMPARDGDHQQIAMKKQEMERYADYRNYLTFSMYERIVDSDGNEKKNLVDEMAGRDSGGEGQNPKYVALLAGFAMLYMQQSNRDSRIKLVLLDEAFSKMDKERSEVCLKYARRLNLQLIVCVPDERLQSLISNVDCVYGFRRHHNQISMMHIDKGAYLHMVEGSEENGQEGRNDDADSMADSAD